MEERGSLRLSDSGQLPGSLWLLADTLTPPRKELAENSLEARPRRWPQQAGTLPPLELRSALESLPVLEPSLNCPCR